MLACYMLVEKARNYRFREIRLNLYRALKNYNCKDTHADNDEERNNVLTCYFVQQY